MKLESTTDCTDLGLCECLDGVCIVGFQSLCESKEHLCCCQWIKGLKMPWPGSFVLFVLVLVSADNPSLKEQLKL